MDEQLNDISTSIQNKQNSIAAQLALIEEKEAELQRLSARMDALNAEIRDARASLQAVHGQEGGPAYPADVTQADYTSGYRYGGYGSGEAPAADGFNEENPKIR